MSETLQRRLPEVGVQNSGGLSVSPSESPQRQKTSSALSRQTSRIASPNQSPTHRHHEMSPQEHRGADTENDAKASEKKKLGSHSETAGDLESRAQEGANVHGQTQKELETSGRAEIKKSGVVDISRYRDYGFFSDEGLFEVSSELTESLKFEEPRCHVTADGRGISEFSRNLSNDSYLFSHASRGSTINRKFDY